jgi:hypothetical protein
MKKVLALITALTMLVSFTACGKNTEKETTTVPDSPSYSQTPEADIPEETTEAALPDNTEATETSDVAEETTDTVSTVYKAADPSQWTAEEIVEFYKNAAAKSNPTAKSSQVMVLNKLIINNGEGALGFFTKILEPAIRSVVQKNALEFDGITGGFHDLSVSDTKSVKAYKSGEYTVVEMTLRNQTDDIHANEHEGTVGHAISVLGDIGRVIAEFPQFNVDLSNAKIDVHYVNAFVKVKINKNGIIEKGTWQYTCDPDINNVKISGINVHTADAEIDYIITVGSGF